MNASLLNQVLNYQTINVDGPEDKSPNQKKEFICEVEMGVEIDYLWKEACGAWAEWEWSEDSQELWGRLSMGSSRRWGLAEVFEERVGEIAVVEWLLGWEKEISEFAEIVEARAGVRAE